MDHQTVGCLYHRLIISSSHRIILKIVGRSRQPLDTFSSYSSSDGEYFQEENPLDAYPPVLNKLSLLGKLFFWLRAHPGPKPTVRQFFEKSPMLVVTDYGRLMRKLPSLHGRKSDANPKLLGTAEHISSATSAQNFKFLWFLPSLGVRRLCLRSLEKHCLALFLLTNNYIVQNKSIFRKTNVFACQVYEKRWIF